MGGWGDIDIMAAERGAVDKVIGAADRIANASTVIAQSAENMSAAIADIRGLIDNCQAGGQPLPDDHPWASVRIADIRRILERHGL